MGTRDLNSCLCGSNWIDESIPHISVIIFNAFQNNRVFTDFYYVSISLIIFFEKEGFAV